MLLGNKSGIIVIETLQLFIYNDEFPPRNYWPLKVEYCAKHVVLFGKI